MATQSTPELHIKLEEIKSLPVMRLRPVTQRWIFFMWLAEWFAFSAALILTLYNSHTVVVLIGMSIFGGWQLGRASERNDWRKQLNGMVATNCTPSNSLSNPPKDTKPLPPVPSKRFAFTGDELAMILLHHLQNAKMLPYMSAVDTTTSWNLGISPQDNTILLTVKEHK